MIAPAEGELILFQGYSDHVSHAVTGLNYKAYLSTPVSDNLRIGKVLRYGSRRVLHVFLSVLFYESMPMHCMFYITLVCMNDASMRKRSPVHR